MARGDSDIQRQLGLGKRVILQTRGGTRGTESWKVFGCQWAAWVAPAEWHSELHQVVADKSMRGYAMQRSARVMSAQKRICCELEPQRVRSRHGFQDSGHFQRRFTRWVQLRDRLVWCT